MWCDVQNPGVGVPSLCHHVCGCSPRPSNHHSAFGHQGLKALAGQQAAAKLCVNAACVSGGDSGGVSFAHITSFSPGGFIDCIHSQKKKRKKFVATLLERIVWMDR